MSTARFVDVRVGDHLRARHHGKVVPMDITALIAAAPVVRRAWKFTPAPLRIPLIVAGAAFVAWRWFADQQDESSTDGSETAAT